MGKPSSPQVAISTFRLLKWRFGSACPIQASSKSVPGAVVVRRAAAVAVEDGGGSWVRGVGGDCVAERSAVQPDTGLGFGAGDGIERDGAESVLRSDHGFDFDAIAGDDSTGPVAAALSAIHGDAGERGAGGAFDLSRIAGASGAAV